jgi:Tol biopolymer transport system component
LKQRFRLADYYSLRTVSEVAVSPDGRRVAFVVEGFRKKDNDRYQNLWVVPTDGSSPPHRLTRGPTNDSSPGWSPDGRYLAFLSTREHEIEVAAALAEEEEKRKRAEPDGGDGDDEEPKPQIWVFDLQFGGEPRQVTRREEGVAEFDWSPEGTHLVFSSRDPTKEQKEYLKSIRGQGKPKDDRGPHVIRRTWHKHDGTGYLDEVRTHLFVVDVRDRKERRLTSGPCDETSPRWSPDGRWIASSPTGRGTRTTTGGTTCGSSARTGRRSGG